ncbi:MAG: hypothetical protein GF310_07315 [candidate division Zixibacteria bacterium]|nr:hypothetical protein [candidate division Zixibacteria bacterium]
MHSQAQYTAGKTERGTTESLSEFFNVFSKGIKTSLIYPPDNPIPREFKRSGWNKLKKHLQHFGSIEIDIDSDSFLDRGSIIHNAPSREENLPRILHRDGIRRLLFRDTLEQSEWEQFFDDILTVIRAGDDYEDLVNLFWQRDFANIDYDVVDNFSLAEIEDDYTGRQSQEVEYSDVIFSESRVENENALDALNDQSTNEFDDIPADQDSIAMFKNIQEFSSAERSHLEELMAADADLIIEFEAIDLVFDILLSEDEMTGFDESVETIDSMFDKMLENEQFPLLVYLIKRMKECHSEICKNSQTFASKFKDSLARVGDRIRIAKITNLLNSGENCDLDGIRLYLEELEWESLPSLIWMLGELNYFPARKMVIEALANKGRQRIDIIGNAIYDSRWYVIRNAALILGEIGNPKGLSYLRKAMEHFDERVRWEAVAAIEKLASLSDLEILLPHLRDDSQRIRHKIIEMFSTNCFKPAFDRISIIIKSGSFNDMEYEEQRDFLKALALTGEKDALPILKKMVKKINLFSSESVEKKKEAALHAISLIEIPEAWEFIEYTAKKKKGSLGNLAKLILEKKGPLIADKKPEENQ